MRIALTLTLAVVIILSHLWVREAHENGCMNGVAWAYLSDKSPTFNPDEVISKHCFNRK